MKGKQALFTRRQRIRSAQPGGGGSAAGRHRCGRRREPPARADAERPGSWRLFFCRAGAPSRPAGLPGSSWRGLGAQVTPSKAPGSSPSVPPRAAVAAGRLSNKRSSIIRSPLSKPLQGSLHPQNSPQTEMTKPVQLRLSTCLAPAPSGHPGPSQVQIWWFQHQSCCFVPFPASLPPSLCLCRGFSGGADSVDLEARLPGTDPNLMVRIAPGPLQATLLFTLHPTCPLELSVTSLFTSQPLFLISSSKGRCQASCILLLQHPTRCLTHNRCPMSLTGHAHGSLGGVDEQPLKDPLSNK